MGYGARDFNKKSYDKNDSPAKERLIRFLTKKGHTNISSEETMGMDITSEYNGKKFNFEVENKNSLMFTTRESFKYPTVSFCGRKDRLKKYSDFFYYIIICPRTDWALSCRSYNIFHKKYEEELYISTEDREGMDLFYRVPKEDCFFFDLNK